MANSYSHRTPKYGSTNEALLALSEGLISGSRNPNVYSYEPHAKQEIFHKDKRKKKLYIGGNRSGKTTGGVIEDIWWATCKHPYRPEVNALGPKRMRVIAVDFTNGVEKIIFPQFSQWLYPSALRGGAWETAYDKTLRTLYFQNGSFIEFMSYDQDLDKFAGTSRHYIHFDEEPPHSIYIENLARLVDVGGSFAITMTPVEGMTWVYDLLYEPAIEGDDKSVCVVEVDMTDNPHLDPESIKDFINSIDEEEREARIQGKFVQLGGKIYKKFDPERGKKGGHVLKDPIEDVQAFCRDKLVAVSLDHGLNNPTAVLWHAVDERGFITTFHEHYKKDWTVDLHAAQIKKINKQLGVTPEFYIADPSIKNRDSITGTSIHQEYLKYGVPFTLGNNDVRAGITRTRRYMNITAKGYPRWRVTPNCEMTIWELKRYRWKTYTQKKLNYENNNFEEPHKKDDHACDSLRYFIMSRPDLIAESPQATSDELVNKLQVSTATSPGGVAYADPHGKLDRSQRDFDYSGGTPETQWEYDEHLGGLW